SVSSLTTDYLISSYLICYVHNMASTNFFTLSLHDALPISPLGGIVRRRRRRRARVTASTDTAPPTAPQAPLRRTLGIATVAVGRSEEHTSELQSRENLVCRLLLEKKNKIYL